jgi:hypothetical protein
VVQHGADFMHVFSAWLPARDSRKINVSGFFKNAYGIQAGRALKSGTNRRHCGASSIVVTHSRYKRLRMTQW